jgi:hypothetical protein
VNVPPFAEKNRLDNFRRLQYSAAALVNRAMDAGRVVVPVFLPANRKPETCNRYRIEINTRKMYDGKKCRF